MTQQFAVNNIFMRLWDTGGVFSVNGPPGTGKTTLLRDIISEIVVRRAMEIVKFNHPTDAFTLRSKGNEKIASLYELNSRLLGYEIVVASANNGAVENVTNEIPSIDSIDKSWIDLIDYFKDISDVIHKRPTWALMAASLGNASKRSNFVSDFWFGDRKLNESLRLSMRDVLNNVDSNIDQWNLAVKEFKAAIASEKIIRNQRQSFSDAIKNISGLESNVNELSKQLTKAENRKDDLKKQQKSIESEIILLDKHVKEAELALNSTLLMKPGRFVKLFCRRRYAKWVKKHEVDRNKYDGLLTNRDHANNLLNSIQMKYQDNSRNLDEIQKKHTNAKQALESANLLLENALKQLQHNFPNKEYWDDEDEKKHISAPWMDEQWNQARTEVFLKALNVHREFIFGAKKKITSNLYRFMSILSGNYADIEVDESIRSLWGTLFLIIPVVSTTFASFAQLFEGMGRESLGWLLIDEAGQAAPQLPVGAVWRSKRVVMVGDPLQLEPVVTTPATIVKNIREQFDIDGRWDPHEVSAQILADTTNPVGTIINALWVGSPLRVHRRCRSPMFEISNEIAYMWSMIHQGPQGDFNSPLGDSAWFNVKGETKGKHWVPQEGELLKKLITSMENSGIESWYVITPFSNVSTGLRRLFPADYHEKIGTIHTFQGKEADVVFLVLGTGNGEEGPRSWAASKPNLLNVAVTRAIHRLYVIGNRDLWRNQKFFKTLCSSLPIRNMENDLLDIKSY